jgi:hypothetical protein
MLATNTLVYLPQHHWQKKFAMTGTWTQRAFVQAFAFRPHGEGLELDGVGHRLGDDGHVGDRLVPPRRFRLVFDHAGVDVIKTYFASPCKMILYGYEGQAIFARYYTRRYDTQHKGLICDIQRKRNSSKHCRFAECCYTKCLVLLIVVLNVMGPLYKPNLLSTLSGCAFDRKYQVWLKWLAIEKNTSLHSQSISDEEISFDHIDWESVEKKTFLFVTDAPNE